MYPIKKLHLLVFSTVVILSTVFTSTTSAVVTLKPQPMQSDRVVRAQQQALNRVAEIPYNQSLLYLPLVVNNYCAGFNDDFENPLSGWPIAEDASARYEYLNGEYRILSYQAFLFFARAPECVAQNYAVETDARWDGSSGGTYGLLVGVVGDFDQFYLFDINSDNQIYRLLRGNYDGSITKIVDWTSSPAIYTGTTSNHIKVTYDGRPISSVRITLEINGQLIVTREDSAIPGFAFTRVGVASSPYSDVPVSDARFDNFQFVKLPSTNWPLQPSDAMSSLSRLPVPNIFNKDVTEMFLLQNPDEGK